MYVGTLANSSRSRGARDALHMVHHGAARFGGGKEGLTYCGVERLLPKEKLGAVAMRGLGLLLRPHAHGGGAGQGAVQEQTEATTSDHFNIDRLIGGAGISLGHSTAGTTNRHSASRNIGRLPQNEESVAPWGKNGKTDAGEGEGEGEGARPSSLTSPHHRKRTRSNYVIFRLDRGDLVCKVAGR